MDFLTPILDILIRLWDCVAEDVKTIRGLKSNVKALDEAMDQLENIKEDVARRVQLAEQRHMVRRKHVDSWIQRVESLAEEVKDVSEKSYQELQRSCWSCCPNSCWSRYNLGEEMNEKLETIRDLKSEGKFDVVADLMPRGPVDERPLDEKIGLNSEFEELQELVMYSKVKNIGIQGMGGVGKTTLLRMLNNDFVRTTHGFDFVLWVVVSKGSNVEKVQEEICEQLQLAEETWKGKSVERKSVEILHVLRTKKFVIMLDDLWERLDLRKVGIPTSNPYTTSKVVFTTRFEDVCGRMGAEEIIRVKCLGREEAFTLFKKNVGMRALNAHPIIPKLAETVVEECGGLPLALVVVGRAMANKCQPHEWDREIAKLRKDPSRITGMDEEVFQTLKLSYDNLRDDIMRSCFIYCCIYPEDYEIEIRDLVDLWIGEGFLEEFGDTHDARDRGLEIVEDLKAASLLEKGKQEECVKMHDIIRDMALWISKGSQGKINKYMVLDHVELLERQSSISRTATEKISLWGGGRVTGIPENQSWPNVSTFVARSTKVEKLPSGLVQFMYGIKVLDLSSNIDLTTLPSSICGLTELEFLNISNTKIRELPIELKKLVKMKFLLLHQIIEMAAIPRKVISSFSLLRVFRISRDASDEDDREDNVLRGGRSKLLEELESLQHLSDICITLSDAASVNKLQHSSKLKNCVSSLILWEVKDLSSFELSSSFVNGSRNLERLHIAYCEKLIISCEPHHGVYFNCLRQVTISVCESLVHLRWLACAPALELLHVSFCGSMVEIVGQDSGIFSRLKQIRLLYMRSLRSICPNPLPFPSLVKITIVQCASLRRLPFDSSSAKGTLKEIKGDRAWWDQLQWDDQVYEPLFRPYFVHGMD